MIGTEKKTPFSFNSDCHKIRCHSWRVSMALLLSTPRNWIDLIISLTLSLRRAWLSLHQHQHVCLHKDCMFVVFFSHFAVMSTTRLRSSWLWNLWYGLQVNIIKYVITHSFPILSLLFYCIVSFPGTSCCTIEFKFGEFASNSNCYYYPRYDVHSLVKGFEDINTAMLKNLKSGECG